MAEIKKDIQVLSELEGEFTKGKIRLVYGAKDEEHSDAVILKEYLENK